MARLLQLLQGSSQSSDLAAWTAVVFALITALILFAMTSAYPPSVL